MMPWVQISITAATLLVAIGAAWGIAKSTASQTRQEVTQVCTRMSDMENRFNIHCLEQVRELARAEAEANKQHVALVITINEFKGDIKALALAIDMLKKAVEGMGRQE